MRLNDQESAYPIAAQTKANKEQRTKRTKTEQRLEQRLSQLFQNKENKDSANYFRTKTNLITENLNEPVLIYQIRMGDDLATLCGGHEQTYIAVEGYTDDPINGQHVPLIPILKESSLI